MTSPDLERLEKLIAQSSLPPQSKLDLSSGKPPRRRGGLIDFLAVMIAVYTLMVATPIGALVTRAFNAVSGTSVRTRSLVSYFSTGASGTSPTKRPEVSVRARIPSVLEHAREAQIDPNLGQALALVLSEEGKMQNGAYDVRLPSAGRASWAAVESTMPADGAPAHQRQRILLKGMHRLTERLGGQEAAVTSAIVELHRVEYAVGRARAADIELPHRYTAFRPFLSPADRAAADPIVRTTFALTTAFGMGWPVAPSARVSSPFGWRKHPVLGRRKRHTGVDLAVKTGTPIRAVAKGEVVYASRDSVNGHFVKIDHGHGLTTAYCHASKLLVKRGGKIRREQQIALSGASGRVSGPHLHFQMELDGVPVDPELFRSGGTEGETPNLEPHPAPPPPTKSRGAPKARKVRRKPKPSAPNPPPKDEGASTERVVQTSSSARSTDPEPLPSP